MSSLQEKAASSFGTTAIAFALCLAASHVVANTDANRTSDITVKTSTISVPKKEVQPTPKTPPPPPTLESTLDPVSVQKGKQNYDMFCLACHGAEGTTIDSPSNLFDPKWYNGSGRDGIEKTIRDGIMEKGMPGWGAMIPAEDITALVDYLISFQTQTHP